MAVKGSEFVKILYQTPIVADYSFASLVGRVFVAVESAGESATKAIALRKNRHCGRSGKFFFPSPLDTEAT